MPCDCEMLRDDAEKTPTIASGTAVSNTIDFRDHSMMIVHIPATWTAADLSFRTATAVDGTFDDLYDETGTLLEVAGVTAGNGFVVPARLAPAHFVQIVSQSAGVTVNQAADRVLTVELKS